ncbi:MAG: hypothetical protein AAF152_16645 [Cyanobacteria bacterium P01_A01_bin.114]
MVRRRLLYAGASMTLGLLTVGGAQEAMAASMTATLTADNHYALFTGNESGTEWNFIGRNEKGAGGVAQKDFVYNEDGSYNSTYIGEGVSSGDVANGGSYNWSMPETWTYDIEGGDYLYVAVWDDSSVTESWIGQFVSDALEDGMLLSQAEDWEYIKTVTHETNDSWGVNPGDNGDTPATDDLAYQVATANAGVDNSWVDAQKKGDNGVNPWGSFVNKGISSEADFLYTTTDKNDVAGGNNQKYTVFRTRVAVLQEEPDAAQTPEPSSVLGLAMLGMLRLRFKRR